jgi:hypothetical protein
VRADSFHIPNPVPSLAGPPSRHLRLRHRSLNLRNLIPPLLLTPEGKIRTASNEPRPETAVIGSRAGTIQLADGHYEPGFKWIEDLPKAATAIKEADKPYLEPRVEPAARQLRTAAPRPPAQTPEPFKALIDVVMLPFDFLIYPMRRE